MTLTRGRRSNVLRRSRRPSTRTLRSRTPHGLASPSRAPLALGQDQVGADDIGDHRARVASPWRARRGATAPSCAHAGHRCRSRCTGRQGSDRMVPGCVSNHGSPAARGRPRPSASSSMAINGGRVVKLDDHQRLRGFGGTRRNINALARRADLNRCQARRPRKHSRARHRAANGGILRHDPSAPPKARRRSSRAAHAAAARWSCKTTASPAASERPPPTAPRRLQRRRARVRRGVRRRSPGGRDPSVSATRCDRPARAARRMSDINNWARCYARPRAASARTCGELWARRGRFVDGMCRGRPNVVEYGGRRRGGRRDLRRRPRDVARPGFRRRDGLRVAPAARLPRLRAAAGAIDDVLPTLIVGGRAQRRRQFMLGSTVDAAKTTRAASPSVRLEPALRVAPEDRSILGARARAGGIRHRRTSCKRRSIERAGGRCATFLARRGGRRRGTRGYDGGQARSRLAGRRAVCATPTGRRQVLYAPTAAPVTLAIGRISRASTRRDHRHGALSRTHGGLGGGRGRRDAGRVATVRRHGRARKRRRQVPPDCELRLEHASVLAFCERCRDRRGARALPRSRGPSRLLGKTLYPGSRALASKPGRRRALQARRRPTAAARRAYCDRRSRSSCATRSPPRRVGGPSSSTRRRTTTSSALGLALRRRSRRRRHPQRPALPRRADVDRGRVDRTRATRPRGGRPRRATGRCGARGPPRTV